MSVSRLVSNMAKIPTVSFINGSSVPIVGLGTWKSKPGEVEDAVKHAIDIGYRVIDCAWIYGNEAEVGNAIASKIADGTVAREDLFIISKLWNAHHRPDLVKSALERSLKNLQTSYLDMYMIHWPMAFQSGFEEKFPRDEAGNVLYEDIDPLDTYKAIEECHAANLVKHLGVSNFNSKQVQRIFDNSTVKPVVNQVELHPYFSQKKLNDYCNGLGILLMAYSPLGSPDRPWAAPDEPCLLEDSRLKELANKYGKSPAQIVLRWHTQRGIMVIPKSVTPSRIKENFEIFNFELKTEDMEIMNALNRDWRAVAPYITVDGKRVLRDRKAPHFPFHEEF